MSKVNARLIGIFVVITVGLVVAITVVLNSGILFKDTLNFVIYFEGSIKGLHVGARVDINGVRVGTVRNIRAQSDRTARTSIQIAVYIEIDPAKVPEVNSGEQALSKDLKFLVDRGLRAQLATTSLVTGQKYISLDFLPDTPVRLVDRDKRFPELPTVQSGMERLERSVDRIATNLPQLLASAQVVLDRAATLFSPENQAAISGTLGNLLAFTSTLQESDRDLRQLLRDAAATVDNLRRATSELDVVMDRTTETVVAVGDAARSATSLLEKNDAQISALIGELRSSAQNISRLSKEVEAMASENREGIRHFTGSTLYEVDVVLEEAKQFMRQLTRVVENLERDPARFLFGDQSVGMRSQ